MIMRRELPRQDAQLRFENVGGYRLTALATNTRIARLVDLEVRHRLRERCRGIAYGAQKHRARSFPLAGLRGQPRPVPSHGPGPQAVAHHDHEGPLALGKARPLRPDTRQTVTPTCHNQLHDTCNDATDLNSTSR